jgi:hypothetical protein
MKKITSYFTCTNLTLPSGTSTPVSTEDQSTSSSPQAKKLKIDSESSVKTPSHKENDIGLFTNPQQPLSDKTKHMLLTDCWNPGKEYIFPKLVVGKQTRSFKFNWLEDNKWLAYSEKFDGGFCKFCVMFAPSFVTKADQRLLGFVTTPLKKFKDAKEMFRLHESTQYHKRSVEFAEEFSKVYNHEKEDIRNQLSSHRKIAVETNRRRLRHIVACVEFCGRQELPLRGKVDSGSFDISKCSPQEGTFRAALRLRISERDEVCQSLFQCAPRNATYMSPQIQNEMIEIMGQQIETQIVTDVKKARFFSVLVDETIDVSRCQQLSLSLRYVHENNLREEFVTFVIVQSTTGTDLAETIFNTLHSLGLDSSFLRGQGYDGASNMSGRFSGVQSIIRNKHPLAMYTHCSSHLLNLAVCSAASTPAIRNAFGTVQSCGNFFARSAQRSNALMTKIEGSLEGVSHSRLQPLCETRWVERHEALIIFLELFPAVVEVLEEIQSDSCGDSSCNASILLNSITSCGFVIALICMEKVAALLMPLSRQLQSVDLDIFKVNELISDILSHLATWRRESEQEFSSIFHEANNLCKKFDIMMKIPRLTSRQTLRSNYVTDSPESYFRASIFVPYLDHVIMELSERFEDQRLRCASLWCILPKYLSTSSSESILKLIEVINCFT